MITKFTTSMNQSKEENLEDKTNPILTNKSSKKKTKTKNSRKKSI